VVGGGGGGWWWWVVVVAVRGEEAVSRVAITAQNQATSPETESPLLNTVHCSTHNQVERLLTRHHVDASKLGTLLVAALRGAGCVGCGICT